MKLTIDLPEEKSQQRPDAKVLGRQLEYMASQVAADTTTEEMVAALQEALSHIRPQRSRRRDLPAIFF